MLGGSIRLRERRAVRAGRRPRRWRLPVSGGAFVLVIGAACWAPLAPTVLAPGSSGDAPDPVSVVGRISGPTVLGVAIAPSVPVLPTPVPTAVPTPVVVPTLSASGRAVLDGISADRNAQWVKNHTETALRSGPSDDAQQFTMLPQWSLLKQVESRPDWLMVQYGGDGDTRQPGPGWVRARDVGGVDAPTVWLRTGLPGTIWTAPDTSARRVADVPRGTLMEVVGPDFIQATRVHVRSPGDGRSAPPSEGWIDGDAIARTAAPGLSELPWAYPEDLRADVRLRVPYRTQLDGSDYAGANCGPTVLGMALESLGVNLPPPDVRGDVLNSENFDPTDTDAGSFIWALADVAQSRGIHAQGLYAADGALHHWTTDEIRASLNHGQPVIVQVVYRGLPGRSDSGYYGDHYIIVTGLLGDKFLYNDPIGGAEAHEAPGYDRIMSTAQLEHAMHASDTTYAFSAFSVSR